ncbi:MAG TPA: nuclear transport factor 2 family protein [Rhodocyclaceae bacterium]|jgi:ketosteroid isomerase-like protein|nr:nuclear transport factor 2 family protein [Rhodocyclaceae bacterium]HNM23495.1 nuclear transport factor 2 family protein [Rhodocyclaceae bacterium]HNM82629.1 nuclear transport factor 2 family protein [Rhodocyclaceae bacterium]HNP04742.1 nuclear transport factor 2 family protein [Rhodocyclaceae bacterium]
MTQPSQFPTPEDVESAFYEAVARGDIEALILAWSEDEEVVCIHPTGVRLTELALIRESWRQILASSRLRVRTELQNHWQSMVLAVHHLTETLYLGDHPDPQGTLHVTHVFSRGAHGWRLISRHASPVNDEQTPAAAETGSHTLH